MSALPSRPSRNFEMSSELSQVWIQESVVSPTYLPIVQILIFTHLSGLEANAVEQRLPLQKIGHHPAVLVFIGILVGNTANADDLGIQGEIGRTMLPSMLARVEGLENERATPPFKAGLPRHSHVKRRDKKKRQLGGREIYERKHRTNE
jgi:hypothetical protein